MLLNNSVSRVNVFRITIFLLWRVEMNKIFCGRAEQWSPVASDHIYHIGQKHSDLPHQLQESTQDTRSSHFPKYHIFSHVYPCVSVSSRVDTHTCTCSTRIQHHEPCYAKVLLSSIMSVFHPLFLHLGLDLLLFSSDCQFLNTQCNLVPLILLKELQHLHQ